MTLPEPRVKSVPIVDDLTTLPPGYKIAVYPGGVVEVVKDENYVKTALDPKDSKKKRKKAAAAAAALLKEGDIPEEDDSDEDVPEMDDAEDMDNDSDEETPKKVVPSKKKKAKTDDSSEDEGDALEDDYIRELELLEEEEPVDATAQAPPAKKAKKAKVLPKSNKKVLPKKQPLKKSIEQSA